jgi:hypothetical protein
MSNKTHYCTCRINLSGQNCHIITYDQHNAVSWPEVQVLMALHGDENVMDIMPISIGEVWVGQEKDRLIGLYGRRVVEACFPGRTPRMELMMTGEEDLPVYGAGKVSTKVHEPGKNGDDDEEDDDETAKVAIGAAPVFKPGRHHRPTPPDLPKEA